MLSELQKFDMLVEASPLPCAIYSGLDLTIISINQGMLDIFSATEPVIGKSLKNVLSGIKEQNIFIPLENVFKSGNDFFAYETPVNHYVDGKWKSYYFNYSYKAIKNDLGEVIAVINIANDVTNLVKIKKESQEVQERLNFALKSAEVGIWDLIPIQKKVTLDLKTRELLGYEEEEIDYAGVLKCIYPRDLFMFTRAILAAVNPNSTGTFNIRFRTINPKTNLIRWVNCKGNAYFNEIGHTYRFAGTAQDITEEVKSRRREEQLLSLVNNNHDQMTVADLDGTVLYMNTAARNLLGVDLNEDLSKYNSRQFYYNSVDYEETQHLIHRDLTGKSNWSKTVNLVNIKTREIIPCLLNFILIRDPETGKVSGRGVTTRDLRPEIKSKANLQRLATIVDSAEDFSNYCDINGNTLYINPSGLKLINLDSENIKEKTLYDYHSEKSNALIQDEILPVLIEKGKWSGELELVDQKTGEIIPIHKQLYMIREEITNEPVAIAGIGRDMRPDINATKEITAKNLELQNVITELEFLANMVPSVVWTSKINGDLDYLNDRWYEQSGLTEAESLGRGWTTTVHPDDIDQARALWLHSLETGDPYEMEFRFKDKLGNYHWYLVRGMPLRNSKGEIIKWYGANTNIQVQKELEQQKDNFLGVASHELKTPVTSLKAYAQIVESMLKKSGDFKNAELLSKMNKQIDRLIFLIKDLLDVTKLNSGLIQYNQTNFNFNEMVEEVLEDVQHTSTNYIFEKHLNFKGDFFGDRDRICQVITNFLTNAVKYSPNSKKIIIRSDLQGNEVKVSVQDFGIGINEDKKDRVFEQFYRVSGNKEHTFPGLGLGLFVSAEIIKRLKGKIWVESEEGKGSIFSFTLPLQ
jgi:PAS domain S-box-containing protein